MLKLIKINWNTFAQRKLQPDDIEFLAANQNAAITPETPHDEPHSIHRLMNGKIFMLGRALEVVR